MGISKELKSSRYFQNSNKNKKKNTQNILTHCRIQTWKPRHLQKKKKNSSLLKEEKKTQDNKYPHGTHKYLRIFNKHWNSYALPWSVQENNTHIILSFMSYNRKKLRLSWAGAVGDVWWVSPDFELFPWVGGRRRQFGSKDGRRRCCYVVAVALECDGRRFRRER